MSEDEDIDRGVVVRTVQTETSVGNMPSNRTVMPLLLNREKSMDDRPVTIRSLKAAVDKYEPKTKLVLDQSIIGDDGVVSSQSLDVEIAYGGGEDDNGKGRQSRVIEDFRPLNVVMNATVPESEGMKANVLAFQKMQIAVLTQLEKLHAEKPELMSRENRQQLVAQLSEMIGKLENKVSVGAAGGL